MATTLRQDAEELVLEAERQEHALSERRAALEREARQHTTVLAIERSSDRPADFNSEDVARAEIELPEIRRGLRLLALDEAKARRATEQARRDRHEARCAALLPRQRAAAQRLDAALMEAVRANTELRAIDDDAELRLGTAVTRWAWPELADETPANETRLAQWRRDAINAGLL